jgi:hypothetical protein
MTWALRGNRRELMSASGDAAISSAGLIRRRPTPSAAEFAQSSTNLILQHILVSQSYKLADEEINATPR